MGIITAGKLIDGYARLKIGMSKSEVVNMFGEPTGVRNSRGVETLTWRHSEFKGLLRGGTIVRAVYCDFEDGVLVGYDSENMDRSRF